MVAEACFSSNVPLDGARSTCPNRQEVQIGPGAAAPCSALGCDHGTHVAGIAAGNDPAFTGVAPAADIIAVQVFSDFSGSPLCFSCVAGYTSDLLAGLDHVLGLQGTFNIAAVNLSLGGGSYSTIAGCPTATSSAIADLRAAGILTVAAAGNNGTPHAMGEPACVPDAVTVGASTDFDDVAIFSDRTSWLDLLAPGEDIIAAGVGGGVTIKSGTSMAAPHVSGAIAALRSVRPDATVDEILGTLAESAITITDAANGFDFPRIALGAEPSSLVRLILARGLAVAIVGAGVGLLISLGLGRALESLLYGVTPSSPLTFAMAALVLLAAAGVAAWLPARRASRA